MLLKCAAEEALQFVGTPLESRKKCSGADQ
jgi:hypothetical protein